MWHTENVSVSWLCTHWGVGARSEYLFLMRQTCLQSTFCWRTLLVFENVRCFSSSHKIEATRIELMRCGFSAKQTHCHHCCTCLYPFVYNVFCQNIFTASGQYMQDSKRATTQKRKDERLAQNRSDATAKRLMVLTIEVVDAVVLSDQFLQVPVTDVDIWWNKLQKCTIHSKLRVIDTLGRCLLLSSNTITPIKLSISNNHAI